METNPTNQTPCQNPACCENECVPEAVADWCREVPPALPPMQPLATPPDEDTALVLFVASPENTLNGFVGIRRNGEYVLPQGDPIPSNYPIVEGWRYFTPEEAAGGQDGIEAAAVKFEAAAASLRSISLLPRNVEAPVDSSEV